jgi:ribosome-associated protein
MPCRDYSTMREVFIRTPFVELYKILKFEGLVENGGAAKSVISGGEVLLNGVVETRKRKKIMAGDVVEFAGEKLLVSVTVETISAGDFANHNKAPEEHVSE